MANYEFRLQGNKLSLGSYSIQKVGDKYIILLNNKIVDVKNNSKLLSDINFVILSIVYDELSKTKLASYDEFITTEHESRYACPWWKTHTITGIGWTSGGAKADLFNATIQRRK